MGVNRCAFCFLSLMGMLFGMKNTLVSEQNVNAPILFTTNESAWGDMKEIGTVAIPIMQKSSVVVSNPKLAEESTDPSSIALPPEVAPIALTIVNDTFKDMKLVTPAKTYLVVAGTNMVLITSGPTCGYFQRGDHTSKKIHIRSDQVLFVSKHEDSLKVSHERNLKPLPEGKSARTPIEHVIVFFCENNSFDRFFGTYPFSEGFKAKKDTPKADNLLSIDPFTGGTYLTTNRNVDFTGNRVNPVELLRNQIYEIGADHSYRTMINNINIGLNDRYILNNPFAQPPFDNVTYETHGVNSPGSVTHTFNANFGNTTGLVLNYYDGNTMRAYWNYAQHYAISDKHFATSYGPSFTGAMNLTSGNTDSIFANFPDEFNPLTFFGTLSSSGPLLASYLNTNFDNTFPLFPLADITWRTYFFDQILNSPDAVAFYASLGFTTPDEIKASITRAFDIISTSKSIGDLAKSKNLSYGWFWGGFDLTVNPNPAPKQLYAYPFGTPPPGSEQPLQSYTQSTLPIIVDRTPDAIGTVIGYVQDMDNFLEPQLYPAFRNLDHIRPVSVAEIGNDGPANHLYDYNDFLVALENGNLPNISFIKFRQFQDGHPFYSNPAAQQEAAVRIINALMGSNYWKKTAIFIEQDESDGGYDHVVPPLIRSSNVLTLDTLDRGTILADPADGLTVRGANAGVPQIPLRPGYGPRLPFIAVSPWTKVNFIDHTVTDITSILRFIEDNWDLGIIGNGSYDEWAGSLDNLFDFKKKKLNPKVFLDPITGEIIQISKTL